MTLLPLTATLFAVACGDPRPAPVEPGAPTPPRVASVSIDPSSLSLSVGEQRQLVATVRDSTGTPLRDRVVQWTSSAPAVISAAATGTGATATVTAVAAGTATITAASEGRSITATVTAVRVDLAIAAAQWTQGVQRPDGGIPMVLSGNAAVLNVLLSATATASPGNVVLRLTDADGQVQHADTVAPPPVTGTATYQAPSAQFLVPARVLRPGLHWQVVRDPERRIADDDSTNDRYPRSEPAPLATVSLAPMRIRFVPVSLSAHDNATGAVSSANLESYLRTLRRIFPMGALETAIAPALVSAASFGTPPNGGSEGFWIQVLQDMDLVRIADTTNPRTYRMAVVRPPAGFTFTNFGGYSYIPASPASTGRGTHISAVVQAGWFTNTTQTPDLVTHELGHALGRRHSPCGGPSGVDQFYPNSNGWIGVVGHDVYAWANGLATQAEPRSASTGDVMGYCFPQWVSPYTYDGLLQARVESEFVPPTTVAGVVAPRRSVAVVRARVMGGRLEVLPVLTIGGHPTATDDAGAYLVELLAEDGRVLASRRTSMRAVDHGTAQTMVTAIALDSLPMAELSTVRVSGPRGRVSRHRTQRGAEVSGPAATMSAPGTDGRRTFRCAAPETAAIVVQERATGAVLATVTGGAVAMPARELIGNSSGRPVDVEVTCSDGVRSTHSIVGNDARKD